MKNLLFILENCETQSGVRKLRSHSQKQVTFESETVVPGKRGRRLLSLPNRTEISNSISNEINQKQKVIPAKRKRRVASTPAISQTDGQPNDTMSKIVAMNCKLTNEILVAKKQLYEKTDDLLKLQELYFTKQAEYKDLQAKTAVMAEQIKELERTVEQLRAEQFCNNLIDFDATAILPASEAPVNVNCVDLNDILFDTTAMNDDIRTDSSKFSFLSALTTVNFIKNI